MFLPILRPIKPRYSFWKEELDKPLVKIKKNIVTVSTQTEDNVCQTTQCRLTDSGYSDVPSKHSYLPNLDMENLDSHSTAFSETYVEEIKKTIVRLKSKIEMLKLRSKSAMCTLMTDRLENLYEQITVFK